MTVLGYKTNELADFYTAHSGLQLEYKVDNPLEAAEIIKAKRINHLKGGILISNPIPEEYAMDKEVIDKCIDDAIKEMDKLGIHGKDSTPFLLAKICELTKGDSLESNIRLVLNNAKIGAQIANEYAKIK